MNPKTTIALLICVAVGGAALFFLRPGPVPTPPKNEGGPKAIFEPKPENVTKVELVAWSKPAIAFEKTGEKWRITAPIQAPADKYQVDNIVTRVTGLQSVRAYAGKDKPGDDLTKLSQPAWVAKLTDKAGKTYVVRIGQPVMLSSETYVQVDGQDGDKVYVVKEDLNTTLHSGLDNYRDKQVSQFATTDATKITLAGATTVVLAKSDGKWTVEQPIRARADLAAVNSLLSAISGAYVSRFVDDQPRGLTRYGLDKPRLTVTIETEKKTLKPPPAGSSQPATQPEYDIERKTIALEFGVVVKDLGAGAAQVYAKLAGKDSPWVFQLAENTLTQATPDLNKLRDKQIVVADTLRATKVHVDGADGAIDLEKQNGLWQITGPAAFASMSEQNRAEFAAVDDLLKAVRDLKATEYEMAGAMSPDYGFGPQATHIEITTEGSLEPAKLTIGGTTPAGTGTYVRNDREDSVAVVKADSIPGLKVAPLAFVSRKLLSLPREQINRLELESDGVTRTVLWDPLESTCRHASLSIL